QTSEGRSSGGCARAAAAMTGDHSSRGRSAAFAQAALVAKVSFQWRIMSSVLMHAKATTRHRAPSTMLVVFDRLVTDSVSFATTEILLLLRPRGKIQTDG